MPQISDEPGPDAYVFGDPPPPPRPPRRRKGAQEAATDADLRALPAAMRKSGIATSARILARDIDAAGANGVTVRDKVGLHHEYRMHMERLADSAPGERKGDVTDAVRDRTERNRLRVIGGGP